jgi:hypothetical protein
MSWERKRRKPSPAASRTARNPSVARFAEPPGLAEASRGKTEEETAAFVCDKLYPRAELRVRRKAFYQKWKPRTET